jgi:hypothetical protein
MVPRIFCILFFLFCVQSSAKTNLQMKVTNGIIVGGGRIGNHLYESNDRNDVLFANRNEAFNIIESCPIYICTRNNDLDEIINKTPLERREDLIFLQNGYLKNYLSSQGLESNTQALIYYAVSKKGEKPIDGITDLNPEGLTAVTGKWAEDFSERMKNAGLACHIYDKRRWEVAMVFLFKLIIVFLHSIHVDEKMIKKNNKLKNYIIKNL